MVSDFAVNADISYANIRPDPVFGFRATFTVSNC